MTQEEIERRAKSIPAEERPVATAKLSGLGDFLGIYGGEHIAATEFVIGALLVTWGVRAKELLIGLAVGNLLATSMYALCTAPIAVDTRLSLFAYLRKATGPWFQRAYNAAWGVTSICWSASRLISVWRTPRMNHHRKMMAKMTPAAIRIALACFILSKICLFIILNLSISQFLNFSSFA